MTQQAEFAPDVRQVDGAGFVDGQVEQRTNALESTERSGKDFNRLLNLHSQTVFFLCNHAGRIGHGNRTKFSRAPGVSGRRAVRHRVDVRIRLADHFVQSRGHHGAGRVTRFERHVGCEVSFLRSAFFEQEVVVVLMDELHQRTVKVVTIDVCSAGVVRVAHVPVGAFEPAGVVRPQVSFGRADARADVAVRRNDLQQVVAFFAHANL